jgi:hypothetical protein
LTAVIGGIVDTAGLDIQDAEGALCSFVLLLFLGGGKCIFAHLVIIIAKASDISNLAVFTLIV